jgi:hypothetical protein
VSATVVLGRGRGDEDTRKDKQGGPTGRTHRSTNAVSEHPLRTLVPTISLPYRYRYPHHRITTSLIIIFKASKQREIQHCTREIDIDSGLRKLRRATVSKPMDNDVRSPSIFPALDLFSKSPRCKMGRGGGSNSTQISCQVVYPISISANNSGWDARRLSILETSAAASMIQPNPG